MTSKPAQASSAIAKLTNSPKTAVTAPSKVQKVTVKNNKKKTIRKNYYYFRVRAYKLDGTKRVYGKWSKGKKVKIKK